MDFNFAANLMQFLVVPTFVLDNEGKVLIWNKACERLTGVAAADLIGTTEHWRAFYEEPRACLADLIVQNRLAEIDALYVVHDDPTGQAFGIRAENWCVMPNHGKQLYLAIDAGPIFDQDGHLVAVVETLRDITVQKRAQTALEGLAYLDGLTGIYNRRAFDEKLEVEWDRSRREQTNLALILIDVDFFKRYNDSYGHQLGDACLKHIATALSTVVVRPQDAVARYGGEEFAVALPNAELASAARIAVGMGAQVTVRKRDGTTKTETVTEDKSAEMAAEASAPLNPPAGAPTLLPMAALTRSMRAAYWKCLENLPIDDDGNPVDAIN